MKKFIGLIKQCGCLLRAVPLFLRCGCFVPHVYEEKETRHGVRIAATQHGFRIAEDLRHRPDEVMHENCAVETLACIHCGKSIMEWRRDDEDIPQLW